jgi:hypothetical protein
MEETVKASEEICYNCKKGEGAVGLLPRHLYLNNCIHWADLHTGPTLSAFILVYDVFFLAFFDGICRTLLGAGSARHTLISDFIRHSSHLLTVRSPLFPFLFLQSPHRFVRRRCQLSFVPDPAIDATHPRKFPFPSPLCAMFQWFLS